MQPPAELRLSRASKASGISAVMCSMASVGSWPALAAAPHPSAHLRRGVGDREQDGAPARWQGLPSCKAIEG